MNQSAMKARMATATTPPAIPPAIAPTGVEVVEEEEFDTLSEEVEEGVEVEVELVVVEFGFIEVTLPLTIHFPSPASQQVVFCSPQQ